MDKFTAGVEMMRLNAVKVICMVIIEKERHRKSMKE